MIDLHAHLDFENFEKDLDQVIGRFFAQGGEAIINIGTDPERSQRGLEIAQKHPAIFCSVGCHPHWAEEIFKKRQGDENKIEKDLEEVRRQLRGLSKSKKVVGIGETGLDYFRQKNEKIRKLQKKLFFLHLEIAQERNLPVIVHCRDAYGDVFNILQERSDFTIILHCYGGGREITEQFLHFPLINFSFCGNITYSKSPQAEIFKAIEMIPEGRILAETDCPFLAPVPFRGRRNEPAFVKETIKKIAQIKNKQPSEMEKIMDQNAKNIFKLAK